MPDKAVNLVEEFAKFEETWSPRVVANVDSFRVKLVKIRGHFTWHRHDDCDEVFLVHRGRMRIDFENGSVELREGELFVVEKGRLHKPFADELCEVLLFERSGLVNTGDVRNELTQVEERWV